jgi:hypothetical protein
MAYIPSLIGAAVLVAICYMLSVMTLTGLQMTAAVAGAVVAAKLTKSQTADSGANVVRTNVH